MCWILHNKYQNNISNKSYTPIEKEDLPAVRENVHNNILSKP